MEKTREKVSGKNPRKQQSLNKAKTGPKKEGPPTNLPRNKPPREGRRKDQHLSDKKTLHSVGKTETKQKAKPLVDPAFSKVEMPALYCFSMNLTEMLPNANKSKKMLDHERKIEMRERKRLIFTKKLHKMYQLAMAHQATFARILAKHSDDFGPNMDPLGSFKVYEDNEDEPSDMTVTEFDPKCEYDEGRRESYCNLNLSMTELIQTLDATKDDIEKLTKLNGKQLAYIPPLFDPTIEEPVDPLNETGQRSNEENLGLATDLEMLSVKDSEERDY